MTETLKDVGRHIGTYGLGHYKATVKDNDSVEIYTIFDDPNKKGGATVCLDRAHWDRLAKWVEFQWAAGAV